MPYRWLRTKAAKLMIKTLMAMAILVGLASSASSQVIGFTANTAAEQYGTYQTANGGLLNIGRAMTVSGSGIEVFQLGVFDYQGEPLAAAHTVTLFDSTQTPVASVTVPAGTAAPLINAFRFAPLGTPVFLPAGNYSILAYQMTASDPYGNGNAPGFNGGGNVSPGNGIYDFTADGSPDYPNGGDVNQGWSTTDPEEFAAVSFTYTNVSPATGIWNGGGGDNNWSTPGNWNGLPIFPTALTFAGSTGLVNTNNNTGITVDGITFDSAAGAFVLDGNDITLAGNIGFSADGIGLGVNPAAPVTQTINLNMAWSTDVTIDTPTNGNLTLNGASTSGNNLFKIDAGTLTLGGGNAIESMDINGGTNIITGNTTINGNGVGYDRLYVGDGDTIADCVGTLVIQPGAVLDIIGSFDDQFVIGRDSGSGTVIQNGGTFTFNPSSMPNSNLRMLLGATGDAHTQAAYDMNGGLLDMSGNNLSVGWGNETGTTGVVNQIGGVITNVNEIRIPTTGGGSGLGVYTLSGGSIYLLGGGIVNDGPSYVINLGGGTVGAEANWSSSLNMNLTNLNGSVTFKPAGNTITLWGALSGNGGLIVTNSGTLILSGANTYTGDTVVNAGSTLELAVPGGDPTTLRLANTAMLNLNYSGNYTVLGFYTNGVALPLGTYNASNLGTFIEGSGNLVVSATVPVIAQQTVAYTANIDTSDDIFNNFLNMGHIFNVSGAGIVVFQLGYFDYQNHALAGPHTVTLFSNETAIASVTIPAGTPTILLDSFAFEPLPMPIYLTAGQYTVLGYGFDNADPNGEGGNIGFNGSANLTVVGACYDWTTLGSPIYPGGPGDNDTDNGPANPNYSLNWDNNTATASLTYTDTVATPPVVNHPVVSGGNLILTGSGGTPGAGYTWLTSTNVATPIASWTTNTVGNFDGSGNFSNAIPITNSTPAQFFRLRTP